MDTDKQNTQSESIIHTEYDRSRQFVLAQTSLAFSYHQWEKQRDNM